MHTLHIYERHNIYRDSGLSVVYRHVVGPKLVGRRVIQYRIVTHHPIFYYNIM